MLILLACVVAPGILTYGRIGVVYFDRNRRGGCSRRLAIVDVLLDESVRTVLPLSREHDVFLLVEVRMLVLRESKGASAKEG